MALKIFSILTTHMNGAVIALIVGGGLVCLLSLVFGVWWFFFRNKSGSSSFKAGDEVRLCWPDQYWVPSATCSTQCKKGNTCGGARRGKITEGGDVGLCKWNGGDNWDCNNLSTLNAPSDGQAYSTSPTIWKP